MIQTSPKTTTPFAAIEDAIEDIRQGKFVIVVDAADRENEGDVVNIEVDLLAKHVERLLDR